MEKGGSRGVRHHDHMKEPEFDSVGNLVIGNYIATVCHNCNARLTNKRTTLNCYMHNGGRYDIHLFLKDIEPGNNQKVYILPKEANSIYMFKIGNISFVDSLNFLPSSLDKLSRSLVEKDEDKKDVFKITHQLL